jgi:hypothetical protein
MHGLNRRRDGAEGRRSEPADGGRTRLPHAAWVYLALTLAFVACLVATQYWVGNEFVQRFGPNFTSELLGIIVTLAFVQRLLARDERARKLRAAVGPLRKGRAALTALIDAWATLLKGAFDSRRTELPRSVEQLFTSDYTEDLARLDPCVRVAPEEDCWVALGVERLREAQTMLRQIIATYSSTLDPEYLEAIDELVDDPFLTALTELLAREPTPQQWQVAVNQARGYREAHFTRLAYALALHNRLARDAARFRSRPLAPSARSLSLQLSADRDLAIPTRLEPQWWKEVPAAGALRAR